MIVRPLTFLAGILFALSGAYLFVVKHQSQSLEDQLEQVAEFSRQDEQAIRVLQAQWALEADPSRIASLAAQFTGLQPMKPGQLVTLASLANTLPAPGSPAPFSNPQNEVPAMPGGGNAAPVPSGPPIEVQGHVASVQSSQPEVTASAAPVNAKVQDEQVADNTVAVMALPKPPPPRPHGEDHRQARLAGSGAVAHGKDEARVRQAAAHAERASSALYEASNSAAPPPAYEASARAAPQLASRRALPMGAQVVRVRATAQAAVEAPPAAPLGGGSLLGMAQTGSQN